MMTKTAYYMQMAQKAAQAELGKPFPQEAELAEKSARLAELDALLNMDDRGNDDPDRERTTEKPSVLASCVTVQGAFRR